MSRAQLQLVVAQPFEEELEVRGNSSPHSLHGHLVDSDSPHPDIIRFLLSKYTKAGELIIDPMCGSGTIALEAALMGRSVLGITSDPLALKLSRARVNPIDFAELAVKLQFMDLKRPVDVRFFSQEFSLFFDVETFCELMNTKRMTIKEQDKASAFIEFILLGILHGHTASHLSVYTDPQRALTPEEQAKLNRRRQQVPAHRDLIPRLLKKGAGLLRDGIPGVLGRSNAGLSIVEGDPRSISQVSGAAASLVVARIPSGVSAHESWLRRWFIGETTLDNSLRSEARESVDFWNEELVELARVVKGGGRAVIFSPGGADSRMTAKFGSEILEMAKQDLAKFWSIEGQFVWDNAKNSPAAEANAQSASTVFVLRRK